MRGCCACVGWWQVFLGRILGKSPPIWNFAQHSRNSCPSFAHKNRRLSSSERSETPKNVRFFKKFRKQKTCFANKKQVLRVVFHSFDADLLSFRCFWARQSNLTRFQALQKKNGKFYAQSFEILSTISKFRAHVLPTQNFEKKITGWWFESFAPLAGGRGTPPRSINAAFDVVSTKQWALSQLSGNFLWASLTLKTGQKNKIWPWRLLCWFLY